MSFVECFALVLGFFSGCLLRTVWGKRIERRSMRRIFLLSLLALSAGLFLGAVTDLNETFPYIGMFLVGLMLGLAVFGW